jgi:beta-lactam-binding protein with PASTA domain
MKFNLSDLRIDFDALSDRIRENSRPIILTGVTILLLTFAACAVVFFLSIKGSEQVMVPDIRGKELAVALLEMQAKELYPRVQLKYSDRVDDKGTVLDQSPAPGAIVKAGRRINVTVSRGVIMDRVENYIGQSVDDVRINLQAMFTSTASPLIVINEPPLARFSPSAAGTILEQDPPPDTPITGPFKLDLVVSKGPQNDTTAVPELVGLSLEAALAELSKGQVIFDFTARAPEGDERAGTVVSQIPAGKAQVTSYSRVNAVVALPVNSPNGLIYGIFQETLPEYPYPFTIKLSAIDPSGERSLIATLKHPGGLLTVPYAVREGTVLSLTILNKEVGTYEIKAPASGSSASE